MNNLDVEIGVAKHSSFQKNTEKIIKVNRTIKNLGYGEQDHPVRYFFSALSELSNKDYFKSILMKILEKRPNITEEHLAYLIYISLQYLTDFDYDKENQKGKIEKDLIRYSDKIIKLCQTNYASTNVIERYAFMQIILAIVNKPSTVIDLGASIGLGLMSLNTDSSHIDMDSSLKHYMIKKANVSKAIGIDIQKPDLKWQLACYLPESMKNRLELENVYKKLKSRGTKISLIKGSVLELDKVKLKADVIWTSNMLYEVEGDLNKVFRDIKSILNTGGIWINADYRYDNKPFATKENPYVAMVRIKENWDEVFEVLEAPSDIVRIVKQGKDFEKFIDACEQIPTIC